MFGNKTAPKIVNSRYEGYSFSSSLKTKNWGIRERFQEIWSFLLNVHDHVRSSE